MLERATVERAEEESQPDVPGNRERNGRTVGLVSLEDAASAFMWFAFDVPNADEVIRPSFIDEDRTYKTSNALYEKHSFDCGRSIDRTDPKLIQVIEELGDAANGKHAKLAIVEIPDGVEYDIDEYDGQESIHEVHRSWS